MAHDGQSHSRFSGTAFAHQANRLAGFDGERKIAHGIQPLAVMAIGDGKVLDGQHWAVLGAVFGPEFGPEFGPHLVFIHGLVPVIRV